MAVQLNHEDAEGIFQYRPSARAALDTAVKSCSVVQNHRLFVEAVLWSLEAFLAGTFQKHRLFAGFFLLWHLEAFFNWFG